MQEKTQGLGIDQILDWAKTEFAVALEQANKYQ